MFNFDIHKHNFKHVHFIGIGGISMSGLAEILLNAGYIVSGSDIKNSDIIESLKKKGAAIYIGHNKNNINGADLIVYTSAISKDNPEYTEAIKRNIVTVDRATFLGQLMRMYKSSIAVSGTHGKTTTTAMMSVILEHANLEPTILLGGVLDSIGGNVKIGKENIFLTEACEYKGNFLKFNPNISIILNIEEDHLDYFKDIEHIVETFANFAALLPRNGLLVINNDDINTPKIINKVNCNIVTFGIKNKSNYKADDISFTSNGFPNFRLIINDSKEYRINLKVIGIHNVYNALAAIATAHYLNIPINTIIEAIENYTGTHRRFEIKGSINGIKIIDDYAHHPTEIKATLNAAKKLPHNKIWCVFQPHTYTRTKALLDEFSESFYDADNVIIADIYAAREKDTGLIHSKDLADLLINKGIKSLYIDNFKDIVNYLLKQANEGDIILTVGAGDIYKVAEMLLDNSQ
ncbi:UDP-N-acetylmuramate--L-alanine ligase [Caloranaerobacter azorensis DSM 13643]|uniref:UDP-N-acetylmuramate--L-alanine ligase n=1 Tax=Caloranaerobacter azorensis DSM 13643 TaxID=1121264 RepID=A0A1M5SX04_9FIRM|nr:UDP-N-acetylmuramate--L-alanine ligase [Caloranaerobacter azorensis]SHH43002.1 UDP-N-acetylmuramate--L-alanine ligase [Caloranaerobacter azorensis DSM 13643]